MLASSRRLSSLVDDILDFSKLRRGGLELRWHPVDLRSVADVVLTLCRPLVGDKPLRLVNATAEDLPMVRADEARVQQVLYNLLGNAIKFTHEGEVVVDARQRGDKLVVSVRDTGIGISRQQQQRIFDAFEQASESTAREYGGSGLGLAVSRQLVELHGGRLGVESELGAGSTFSFDLPLSAGLDPADGRHRERQTTVLEAPPAGSPVEVVEDAGPALAASGEVATATVGPGGNILIVDDEPINRQVLVNYLTGFGHRVSVAGEGRAALELLEEGSFDLVLLDIMMPRMSGYEVCRQIRQRWPFDQLPVLFLTAKSQIRDRLAGFAEGGNDYLIKPIARGELVARVDKELELLSIHRGLRDEVKELSGLLPICVSCKKVRDDGGYWHQIESYISKRSEAQFTHGVCPECVAAWRHRSETGQISAV